MMLSKFETKSNRVKGVSFHPKRPWILSALHNGQIQLWDYKMGTLVDKFEEHEGPVRGVAFHPSQEMFCSGGDDYKIKVWSTKQRKCLYTLRGHLDYIRTVSFHHEYPWIISASDDQTIRVWNWQSRNCLSVLTGHSHYVMSAFFHPKDDLIVSASLDQSIRVWDYSGLRKKHTTAKMSTSDSYSSSGPQSKSGNQADLFGATDAVVKFVLEGHDRGVNWATFHPTLPLILSAADDRQIKLWRMNETKAWEVDTCRGHYNNVSAAIFHPRLELIISDSEDKTIRVWDMTKRSILHTFKREERFWTLISHPTLNLFAAGHDSGFVVFKLERERCAMATHENVVYYIKDKFLRICDFQKNVDSPLISLKKAGGLGSAPKSLSFNPVERAILIYTPFEGGSYELHSLPANESSVGDGDCKKGSGQAAVFIARNRFAVLQKSSSTIYIKDLKNEITKQFQGPSGVLDIFYAGLKNILLVTATHVYLYDTELRSSIAEISAAGVRHVIWSADLSAVALLSKKSVVLANKKLEQLASVHESIKVKSGAWDFSVFVYSTLNHIKYILPHGDNGIIKTLERPVYICRVMKNAIHCIDRQINIIVIPFDQTEYLFKLALLNNQYDQVLEIIKTSNLVGQAVIAYLQKKGYSEIALHFVKDPKTRFDLAIECGDLDIALETAKKIDNEATWKTLGDTALKHGNHGILEMTYQKRKNYDKLAFLYMVVGNIEKLKKMGKIADVRGDFSARYNVALMLGDVEEQIRVLQDVGQVQLAYLTAKTNGLDGIAAEILGNVGVKVTPILPTKGKSIKPPAPIINMADENWPLIKKSAKNNLFTPAAVNGSSHEEKSDKEVKNIGAWGDEDLEIDTAALDGGWGIEEELPLTSSESIVVDTSVNGYIMPTRGNSQQSSWSSSTLAVDHICAGDFEHAMMLLHEQIGFVNFAVLKPIFMQIYQSSIAYQSTLHPAPSLEVVLTRSIKQEGKILPFIAIGFDQVIEKMQEAYDLTTAGKFSDCVTRLKALLQFIPFVVVSNETEKAEINDILEKCKEYITGLRMEMLRRELSTEKDIKRIVELAAYFTHCGLKDEHSILSLRSAMRLAYNIKNFGTASVFAKRLLALNPDSQIADQVRTILGRCERTPTDAVQLDYDSNHITEMCAYSLTPLVTGSASLKCPYCLSRFKSEFKGKLCPTCELSSIGGLGSGLINDFS